MNYILKIYFAVICQILILDNGDNNYNGATATNEGYTVDTIVSFTCNYGYTLSGSNSTTCQNSGLWNQETPTCDQGNVRIRLF